MKLYLRKDGHWAGVVTLEVYCKELLNTDKSHAGLDIFDYNLDTSDLTHIFEQCILRK